MKFSLSLSKSQEKTISSSVAVVFIVGILILVNILGNQYFGRIDLTNNKVFTLSKASRELVANLDDNVIAKAYFTSNLPSPYNEYRKFLEDKLAEYKTYSKGKFSYEFIDPTDDSQAQQEAQSYSIQPFQFNVLESDQYTVKNGYMGVVFLYGDKTEVISAITDTTGLEYEISSTIKKLTSDQDIKVAFLQDGDLTLDMYTYFKNANTSLSKLYSTTYADPATMPTDLDVLIVAGVTDTLSDYTLYQIDQALMHGTKVFFMVDNIDVNLQGFTTTEIDNTNLIDMLASYGITVDQDMIADLQAQRISVSTRQGYFTMSNIVDYPLIPYVTDFEDNLITTNLNGLSLPFVSSLTLDDTKLNGKDVLKLAESSDKSWSETDFYNVNPLQQFTIGENKGPFTLGVAIKGNFTSYFSGKAIPTPDSTDTGLEAADESTRSNEIADNRIVVIGTSKIIQDNFLLDQENLDFFVNCVDWLTQNDALISIRSKGFTEAPLRDVSDSTKNLIKWSNILGLPLFVIIIAIVRFRLRKKKTQLVYHT